MKIKLDDPGKPDVLLRLSNEEAHMLLTLCASIGGGGSTQLFIDHNSKGEVMYGFRSYHPDVIRNQLTNELYHFLQHIL